MTRVYCTHALLVLHSVYLALRHFRAHVTDKGPMFLLNYIVSEKSIPLDIVQ